MRNDGRQNNCGGIVQHFRFILLIKYTINFSLSQYKLDMVKTAAQKAKDAAQKRAKRSKLSEEEIKNESEKAKLRTKLLKIKKRKEKEAISLETKILKIKAGNKAAVIKFKAGKRDGQEYESFKIKNKNDKRKERNNKKISEASNILTTIKTTINPELVESESTTQTRKKSSRISNPMSTVDSSFISFQYHFKLFHLYFKTTQTRIQIIIITNPGK